MERQLIQWEEIFLQVIYLIKDLYLECINNVYNSIKQQITQKVGKGSE